MNDLELAVRTIESILPEMPTAGLQKWKGILTTALVKIEAELCAVAEHTCSVCFFKEFGYRDELPIAWREKGDIKICFNHEDAEVASMLKKGIDAEASEPVDSDQALEDLMALI
jgi:hypothetical protein